METENIDSSFKEFLSKAEQKNESVTEVKYISFYAALARTLSTVINRSSDSGHPCSFMMLKRNLLKFSRYGIFSVSCVGIPSRQRKLPLFLI